MLALAQTEQFCTFFLDGHLFGVPVQQVQEVIRYQAMTCMPLAPQVVSGLINLRGQIITAIDLRRRLGMADRVNGELPMNVVVRTCDGVLSLLVDEIGDVLEVETDTREKPPGSLQGPARALVLGVYTLTDHLLLELGITEAIALDSTPEEASHVSV
jgi:purine-binding chemotaxis protein CheW